MIAYRIPREKNFTQDQQGLLGHSPDGPMMTAQTANSAIVEVHLDGSILPNVTLVDSNEQYTTDASGTLVLEDSCLSLRYVDDSNNAFRSMERCGFDDADRLYKVSLSKEITLSGTAEFPYTGNALLVFSNLDNGVDLIRGIGTGNPRAHSFSEQLPAGRYRIVVTSSTYPSPEEMYFISSVD